MISDHRSAQCSEMAEKGSRLEEENRKMDLDRRSYAVRINQLDERLNAVVQLNHQLKYDCTRLESEHEAMSFEKSGFEQMYLEVKAACEEAETKIQMEGELARREIDAKKQQQSQSHLSRQQTEEQMETLEAKVYKLKLDLKKAVEEKGEMRNLEVAMEQLTSEIQELSFKKANLEKLREFLEEGKATAEEETRQLRREVESKELENLTAC
ncbi:hypothetical protein DAPPUDRAFT_120464 [Daphnia pulex]|uniref:Uncharacterized protein n=1 Tax=Daphnia pulex TaxID=6669 RepID=E9I1G5_DAPPU|nr:hypothetical protein DAPPUDRAFT_120464 [Daphnia pulex]|eukprot:EFX62165.1 hypothetical protein DAPPUDRAFT_120464 [Daphnia pulex]